MPKTTTMTSTLIAIRRMRTTATATARMPTRRHLPEILTQILQVCCLRGTSVSRALTSLQSKHISSSLNLLKHPVRAALPAASGPHLHYTLTSPFSMQMEPALGVQKPTQATQRVTAVPAVMMTRHVHNRNTNWAHSQLRVLHRNLQHPLCRAANCAGTGRCRRCPPASWSPP